MLAGLYCAKAKADGSLVRAEKFFGNQAARDRPANTNYLLVGPVKGWCDACSTDSDKTSSRAYWRIHSKQHTGSKPFYSGGGN